VGKSLRKLGRPGKRRECGLSVGTWATTVLSIGLVITMRGRTCSRSSDRTWRWSRRPSLQKASIGRWSSPDRGPDEHGDRRSSPRRGGFIRVSRRRVGPVVIAELDDGMIVASIHARIVEGRTIPTLRKTVQALSPRLEDRRFVVGGDLNTARGAEDIWPGRGHLEFFESLTGIGLYDFTGN
jgi:hypothetical protein